MVASLGGLLFGFDTAVISGTVERVKQQYGLSELVRNHAHDFPPGAKSRIREGAHQPDVPAAINQRDALHGEQLSESFRGLHVCAAQPGT